MLSEVFSAFPSVGYVSHFCVFRVLHLPGSTSWFHRLLHVFVGISRLRLLGCAFQDAGGGGGVGIRGVGRGMITFFLIIRFHQKYKPET